MRKLRVLVADDNPFFRKLIPQFLVKEGYDYRVARDGQEALETAAEFQPDVVITDSVMPRMTGMELCSRLRPAFAQGPVPFTIVMTGTPESSDPKHASDFGVDIYMSKKDLLQGLDSRRFRLDRMPISVRSRLAEGFVPANRQAVRETVIYLAS